MELGGRAFQPFSNCFKSIVIIIFPSQLTRNTRNLSRIVTGWVCTRISSAASERMFAAINHPHSRGIPSSLEDACSFPGKSRLGVFFFNDAPADDVDHQE